ncbi:MAG: hypothetical protein ACE5PT_07120 [Gemmatimonadales bacterium]
MSWRTLRVGAACLLSFLPVARALGQGTIGSCEPVLDSAGTGRRIVRGPGRIHFYGSGGVLFHCEGQATVVSADSGAWYTDLDRLDFVGNVVFEDDTVTLTARRARYYPDLETIEASDEVRLVNRETGSELAGPNLVYRRAVEGVRDTSELVATGHPRIEYRSAEDTSASPYVILPQHVVLRGERLAWAGGGVTVEREDFVAHGDSATLDFEKGEGLLIGNAVAEATDTMGYRISGLRLAYRLTDERLTWVQSQGRAEATSAEWRVVGDTIEFDVANDLIQSGRVWGDSSRATAKSRYYSVAADSLALDAPDQRLEEVRGFFNAYATRRDSTVDVNDWMGGDTVVARFGPGEGDVRALELLEARGNALAYYHIFEEDNRSGLPAINYSRGARIVALFKDDELDRVDVVGAADGVYLEPKVRRP